jgi:hypothetical protein
MEVEKIQEAVRACVHFCLGRDDPLTAFQEYLATLNLSGWDESELKSVEKLSRRVLTMLFDPPDTD